ncbi:MAG: hypothetical protein HC919_04110 [Oscillatoriales cyanobacterium SM2_2_1]|nr:hypothetical protein [Oscillatoriales cyanobacterium SM2_2_1]
MITDPELRAQIYGYFCEEARELLSKIEMDLMRLSQEGDRRVTVHELMRATHTLKGSAASIGLDTIQEIAHLLEDVFKNLYDPTIPLDAELMQLLLMGYDYLQESLNKEFNQPGQGDDPELLNRATELLRRLQVKLGSNLDSTSVPTSTELGLDYVHSVFAESVRLRLDELADLITRADTQMVLGAEFLAALQSHLEVFEGLGISLNLLGFSAIAGTALKALEQNPQRIRDIAALALSDLKSGQQQILGGDRAQGGTLSVAWQSFLPSVGTETLEAAIDRALSLVNPAPVEDEPLSLAEFMSPDPVQPEPSVSLAVLSSATPKPSAPPMVRLEVEILDRLHQTVGDVLVQQQKDLREVKQLLGQLHTLQDQQESLRHVVQQLQDWQERPAFTTLLSKAQAALGDLERSVDALATTAHRTQHLHEQRQQMLIHMHDNLMSARMQPLDDIFNRFWTTVEQLSVKFNKQVGLKITGGDLLVDRAIAAKLYDPLLHLVRNAFDHGIEPLPQRRALGKPPAGTIELNAYRHGGRTVIEVRDDGAGIDPQKIRQRAIERNLFAPLAAYNLSAAELLELLFEPGFSTAPQVSELSGRGIGLDVVRSQMQSINGETAVASTPQPRHHLFPDFAHHP